MTSNCCDRSHRGTRMATLPKALVLAGAGILGLASLTLPAPAAACDMVCVAPDNYETMLKKYKHVLVGRVEHAAQEPNPTFVVKAVRVWKGGKKQITLVNESGMCGKMPLVGRLYVVFASADPESIDMCSSVMGLWEENAKAAVTRLDRARRFRPLSVDAEDLESPY
jgi:hypothetical protein